MKASPSPFEEAAAFFAIFAGSPWGSCHLRTDALEIFASRKPGAANPMSDALLEVAAASGRVLNASHMGTLTKLPDIGMALEEGQGYALVEVLGEEMELVAAEAGIVARHLLPIGALVEYDRPVVDLRSN